MSDAEMVAAIKSAYAEQDQWVPPWLSDIPELQRLHTALMVGLAKWMRIYAEE